MNYQKAREGAHRIILADMLALHKRHEADREQIAAAEAALLNTQDQLKAMRDRAVKAEARARFFKSWSLTYGAAPGTFISDFAVAELRALEALTGVSLRRFLWEA